MKQVEVKILQQSYLLACKEGQETRLTEAVTLVDDAMTRIHDAGKVRARERIAVLAALNLAFELGDLRQAHQQLLERVPEPVPVDAQDQALDTHALNHEAALAFHAQNLALQALITKLQGLLDAPVAAAPPTLAETPTASVLEANDAVALEELAQSQAAEL